MEILATMTSSSTEDGVPCTSETNGGSAGASAFFAKKKKPGKKGFKIFNANKIDASVVASAVHV